MGSRCISHLLNIAIQSQVKLDPTLHSTALTVQSQVTTFIPVTNVPVTTALQWHHWYQSLNAVNKIFYFLLLLTPYFTVDLILTCQQSASCIWMYNGDDDDNLKPHIDLRSSVNILTHTSQPITRDCIFKYFEIQNLWENQIYKWSPVFSSKINSPHKSTLLNFIPLNRESRF